jgi:hypothetical protein
VRDGLFHWGSLFVVCCLLFVVLCSLFVVLCLLFIVRCSLFIVHCSLLFFLRHLPELLIPLQKLPVASLVNDFAIFHVEDDGAVHHSGFCVLRMLIIH